MLPCTEHGIECWSSWRTKSQICLQSRQLFCFPSTASSHCFPHFLSTIVSNFLPCACSLQRFLCQKFYHSIPHSLRNFKNTYLSTLLQMMVARILCFIGVGRYFIELTFLAYQEGGDSFILNDKLVETLLKYYLDSF